MAEHTHFKGSVTVGTADTEGADSSSQESTIVFSTHDLSHSKYITHVVM